MSIVGVEQKSKQGQDGRGHPVFALGSTVQDAIAEVPEVTDAEAGTLENLRFIVAAFSKTVGIGAVERIENLVVPVMDCFGTGMEFRKLCGFCNINPF